MNDCYVLRDQYAGGFIVAKVEQSRMPLTEYRQKQRVDMVAYRMLLRIDPLAGLDEDDVVNPELPQADPPEVEVYCALEEYTDGSGQKQARGFNGDARDANKVVIRQQRGKDFIRHSDFMAIIEAAGVDLAVAGEAKPIAGLAKLRPIYLRVGQLDGSGAYKPRNVYRGWSKDKGTFAEEDARKAQYLLSAVDNSTSAPGGNSGLAMTLNRNAKPAEEPAPKMTLKRAGKTSTETSSADK